MFHKKLPNSVNTWIRIKESPKLSKIVQRRGAFELRILEGNKLRDLLLLVKEIRQEKKNV